MNDSKIETYLKKKYDRNWGKFFENLSIFCQFFYFHERHLKMTKNDVIWSRNFGGTKLKILKKNFEKI